MCMCKGVGVWLCEGDLASGLGAAGRERLRHGKRRNWPCTLAADDVPRHPLSPAEPQCRPQVRTGILGGELDVVAAHGAQVLDGVDRVLNDLAAGARQRGRSEHNAWGERPGQGWDWAAGSACGRKLPRGSNSGGGVAEVSCPRAAHCAPCPMAAATLVCRLLWPT